jgi:hypothetical protein
MRLKLILAVLVALLLVVAAGCGGSKKSSSTNAATTTEAMTTEAMTTEGTTSTGGMALTGNDCEKLAAAAQTVGNAMTGSVPNDINAQVARLQALAKVAPAEIKADFEVLAKAAAEVAKLNLKSGQQPTPAQIQQLMANLNVSELTQASAHISAWAKTNCATG